MDGIFNIYKPAGMTSHDAVARVRKITGIRKAGHTGTLDPMATGVLPVCVGKATRITEYLDCDLKTYRCVMKLGTEYDTQDVWGKPEARADESSLRDLTEEKVYNSLESFKGRIFQKPPMYSAVRVDGRRLYQYARAGQTVDVKPREVEIRELKCGRVDLSDRYEVEFTVTCTKGTYIRALCHDAGLALGVYGAVGQLERLSTGIFRAEDSVTLDELSEMSETGRAKIIVPSWKPLEKLGRAETDAATAVRFANGAEIPHGAVRVTERPRLSDIPDFLEAGEKYSEFYTLFCGEVFLGICRESGTGYKPEKVFADSADLLRRGFAIRGNE